MTKDQARLARTRLLAFYQTAPNRAPNLRDYYPDYEAFNTASDRYQDTLTAVMDTANRLTLVMRQAN